MAEEKAAIKQLFDPKRFQLSEYVNRQHTVTVEQGVTLEDVLNPAFFAHFATQLQVYDELTVRTDDGLWWAKLLVLQCGRTWAKVKVIQEMQLTTADVDQSQADSIDGYEVKWRGPLCKFSVIRKLDNKILVEAKDTKMEAQNWLQEHVKAGA